MLAFGAEAEKAFAALGEKIGAAFSAEISEAMQNIMRDAQNLLNGGASVDFSTANAGAANNAGMTAILAEMLQKLSALQSKIEITSEVHYHNPVVRQETDLDELAEKSSDMALEKLRDEIIDLNIAKGELIL
jgi:uncharacterized protein (DUF1697 family)